MKVKSSVIHLVMLVGLLISCLLVGCSETDHAPLLSSHESNPSVLPAVTKTFSPLPATQAEVAAAPPILAVVPIVSCGATVIEVSGLAFDMPQFLSNNMLFVSIAGMACPFDKGIKAIKGIKILKSSKYLRNIEFKKLTKWNFRKNFEKLIGRKVKKGHEIHHTIPTEYKKQAEQLGVNINQPWLGVEITQTYHRYIHKNKNIYTNKNYNEYWKEIFNQSNLDKYKILEYQQEALNLYGLKQGSYLKLIK